MNNLDYMIDIHKPEYHLNSSSVTNGAGRCALFWISYLPAEGNSSPRSVNFAADPLSAAHLLHDGRRTGRRGVRKPGH